MLKSVASVTTGDPDIDLQRDRLLFGDRLELVADHLERDRIDCQSSEREATSYRESWLGSASVR